MADDSGPTPTPSPDGAEHVELGGKRCEDVGYFISVCDTGFCDPVLRHTIVEAAATLHDCNVCCTAEEVCDLVQNIIEIIEENTSQCNVSDKDGLSGTRVSAGGEGISLPDGIENFTPEQVRNRMLVHKNGVLQRNVDNPTLQHEWTFDTSTLEYVFAEPLTPNQWISFTRFI